MFYVSCLVLRSFIVERINDAANKSDFFTIHDDDAGTQFTHTKSTSSIFGTLGQRLQSILIVLKCVNTYKEWMDME